MRKSQPMTNQEPFKLAATKRNAAWEFFTDRQGFNLPTGTPAQKKRVGRLAREVNAKLDHEDIDGNIEVQLIEMRHRAMSWPNHFPGATLTPEAFEKHFTQLGQQPLRMSESDRIRAATRAAIDALVEDDEPHGG